MFFNYLNWPTSRPSELIRITKKCYVWFALSPAYDSLLHGVENVYYLLSTVFVCVLFGYKRTRRVEFRRRTRIAYWIYHKQRIQRGVPVYESLPSRYGSETIASRLADRVVRPRRSRRSASGVWPGGKGATSRQETIKQWIFYLDVGRSPRRTVNILWQLCAIILLLVK